MVPLSTVLQSKQAHSTHKRCNKGFNGGFIMGWEDDTWLSNWQLTLRDK